jgi:protein TonB
MNFTEKHFYSAMFISLFVHFFVLTVLITKPPTEKPAEFKELKIKLGIKKVDLPGSTHDISQNLYFKQQPLAYAEPIAVSGVTQARKVVTRSAEDESEAAEHVAKIQEAINENAKKPLTENKQENKEIVPIKEVKEVVKVMEPVSKKLAAPSVDELPAPQPLARIMAAQGEGESIGNSTDEEAEDLTSYEQMLPLWLDRFRVYPEEARQLGLEGRGDVFIKIDRNGKVLLSKVIKSTGQPILDKALIKMVEDADPVIPVPPEYHEDKKTFSYKVTFEFLSQ